MFYGQESRFFPKANIFFPILTATNKLFASDDVLWFFFERIYMYSHIIIIIERFEKSTLFSCADRFPIWQVWMRLGKVEVNWPDFGVTLFKLSLLQWLSFIRFYRSSNYLFLVSHCQSNLHFSECSILTAHTYFWRYRRQRLFPFHCHIHWFLFFNSNTDNFVQWQVSSTLTVEQFAFWQFSRFCWQQAT